MSCLICESKTDEIIDFGRMPLANNFVDPKYLIDDPTKLIHMEYHETMFNLKLVQCPECKMVQLDEQPERSLMFNDHYPFFTGSSQYMVNHFQQLASQINPEHFVVEIGSNDGTFISNFVKHLGVEPSKNVFEAALAKNLNCISGFFDEYLAEEIVDQYGQADVIFASNVLCHIKDIHTVMRGIKWLLKPGGVFIFEDPYVGDIIRKASFDQIYDEHCYYWSIESVDNLMKMHDLGYVKSIPISVHSGSLRYYIQHRQTDSGLSDELDERIDLSNFKEAVAYKCDKFLDQIQALEGKTIGYAATSKSTTVLNYCCIGPEIIEYIVDSTPEKQGKLTPGTHIPIKSIEHFNADNVVLFAPNHAKEIREKHPEFKGQWITY